MSGTDETPDDEDFQEDVASVIRATSEKRRREGLWFLAGGLLGLGVSWVSDWLLNIRAEEGVEQLVSWGLVYGSLLFGGLLLVFGLILVGHSYLTGPDTD